MSRAAVMVMAAASALGLLVAGCSQSCGPAKCPTATFDLRVLNDSTATLSTPGSASQTIGVVPYPASGSGCTFDQSWGTIYPVGDTGADTLLGGYFSLRCAGTAAGDFNLTASKLGDVRDWPAGTFTMTPPNNTFGLDYHPGASQPAGPAGTACGVATYLDGIVLTVTVETAAGGRAAYPKLVTDDFVRTFRLDFDTSSVQATNGVGEPCDLALSAQVSLHLTQTAADYVYDADAPCICE